MNLFQYGNKMYARPIPPLCYHLAETVTVPIQVRDEQGRRRLHGAFTGGFSAGYFNTVGSKEGASSPSSVTTYINVSKGWTPSTFVSSRSERAKQKAARPEDFMDEEDLAELRESQIMTGIKEQQQRDVFAGTQAGPTMQQDDPEQE